MTGPAAAERRGWECELKAGRGLAIFENLCRQRSADRERVQAGHACGRAEMQNFPTQSRSDREQREIAYQHVSPIEREAIHAGEGGPQARVRKCRANATFKIRTRAPVNQLLSLISKSSSTVERASVSL